MHHIYIYIYIYIYASYIYDRPLKTEKLISKYKYFYVSMYIFLLNLFHVLCSKNVPTSKSFMAAFPPA